MMILMLMAMLIIMVMTPIKLAFLLVVVSLYTSIAAYSITTSIFCSSAMVISFSSGMMIILCYTAMMSNFEAKNNMKPTLTSFMVMLGMMILVKKDISLPTKENSLMSVNSILIVILLAMVVCSMKAINQSVFTPSKSLISSY